MGQSQSLASTVEDFKSYASSDELKALDYVLESKQDKEMTSQSMFLMNLQAHLKLYFHLETVEKICNMLKLPGVTPNYVKEGLVENVCKFCFGTTLERFDKLFEIMCSDSTSVSLQSVEQFTSDLFKCTSQHGSATVFGNNADSAKIFVHSQIASLQESFNRKDFMMIFQSSRIMSDLMVVAFRYAFFSSYQVTAQELRNSTPSLLPVLEIQERYHLSPETTVLSTEDVVYVNSNLPCALQHKWCFLYSTKLQGESFARLSTQITGKGPLLLIIKDQGGNIFGGFISTSLEYSSRFQGTSECFLFSVRPKLCVYHTTEYNDHYVYFNTHQETMPNGLGMGGQHEYFGLWLSAEFGKGHSKAKPTCTTYKSPQLSCTEEFNVDAVEVWGLGDKVIEEEDNEEEGMTSVIDKKPDAVAILRIAGKERVSEGYRDSEMSSTMPGTTELQHPHDPMDYP